MDFSYSGMRDTVFDELGQVQLSGPVEPEEWFTRYKEGAAERIASEVVFPAIDFALEALGLTREDLDAAIEKHSMEGKR